jgi:Flp pilus assembly protein TadG
MRETKPAPISLRQDRAQILPIMAMLLVVFLGLLGLSIDVGHIFVARTQLSRAVDAAALAGVVELPNATNAHTTATTFLLENQAGATISFPPPADPNQLKVEGQRSVPMFFMGFFGVGHVTIHATAAAGGSNAMRVDSVLSIDSTGSMGDSPCNGSQNNSGCPIFEAKNAAKAYTDTLIGTGTSSNAQVGALPFRGCYNPPRQYSGCVPAGQITALGSNANTVKNGINTISSVGGTGTNVCLGLYEANVVLFGANHSTQPDTRRFIVILTDGDNNYNSVSYGNGAPPAVCSPPDPANSDSSVGGGCSMAQTRERALDQETQVLANSYKAAGVEIYVVGFGVCGTSNTNLCNAGMIGGTSADTTADRNVLKCMASSTTNTNDHYFETATATDLPAIFTQIAHSIAFRLVE